MLTTDADYTDELDPRAATWARQPAAPSSFTQTPRWWREMAAIETEPRLAADMLRMADLVERYLPMRGVQP